jgi:hypothetical protein
MASADKSSPLGNVRDETHGSTATVAWPGQACLAQLDLPLPPTTVLFIRTYPPFFCAGFRSLTEAIDTTTAAGRMLGAFAEFERQMTRERTKLGLARARLEGRIGGNRAALTPEQQAHALAMIDEGKSQSEIAELFGVHRSTICRLVSERRVLAA